MMDLADCPLCGGPARLAGHFMKPDVHAACEVCFTSGPLMRSEDEAIHVWNTMFDLLVDPLDGVVPQHDDEVHRVWGFLRRGDDDAIS